MPQLLASWYEIQVCLKSGATSVTALKNNLLVWEGISYQPLRILHSKSSNLHCPDCGSLESKTPDGGFMAFVRRGIHSQRKINWEQQKTSLGLEQRSTGRSGSHVRGT